MVLGVQEACWQFRSERMEGGRQTDIGTTIIVRTGQDYPGISLFFSSKSPSPFCFNGYQPTVHPFRTRTTRIRTLESEIKLMYHIINSEQRNRKLVCMDSCARNVGLLRKYIPLVVVMNIFLPFV